MNLAEVIVAVIFGYMAWCFVGAVVLSSIDTPECDLLKWYQDCPDEIAFFAQPMVLTLWPVIVGLFVYKNLPPHGANEMMKIDFICKVLGMTIEQERDAEIVVLRQAALDYDKRWHEEQVKCDQLREQVTLLREWAVEAVEFVGNMKWSPSLESQGRRVIAATEPKT